ncbi:MAG: hypothetical protein LBB65_05240 [Burkholderiales bacterium]|jgi:hypothetical protein|nr:hypothetical protein [Burkholderiales bacterium]
MKKFAVLPPTIETLEAAGQALYGDTWQTNMASELGLSGSRRVRAWIAGERPIPPGVWADIAALLRARGAAAIELAERMPVIEK